MLIDLHLHTTASDGVLQPAQLVERAVACGIAVIAVTDHDTVAGVPPAQAAAAGRPVEVVPGIEVTAAHDNASIHVLGLFIDPDTPALQGYALRQAEARRWRLERIVERLQLLNVPITHQEVFARSGDAVPGRPHIARLLLERQLVPSIREAFTRYLGRGGSAWVPYPRITVRQAIALIRDASGLPLIAHPGLDGLEADLPGFIADGACGVEVYHPDHDAPTRDRLLAFCAERGLLVTGGSDYHGYNDDGLPGRGLGETPLPLAQLERLRAAWGAG